MGQDFSSLCILPPYNTLRAQVIARGKDPKILGAGLSVAYSIPGNSESASKTNFWTYAPSLFGVNLALNTGLAGKGMRGTMDATGLGYYEAAGIPTTPMTDGQSEDPYQLSQIDVRLNGATVATTRAVVPVSWEMKCNLCHSPSDPAKTDDDILAAHDRRHGTSLRTQKPVLCAKCHADPALGAAGNPNLPNLSRAMHGAHAARMGSISLSNKCYACHPGPQTQCLRDVHAARGMTCTTCHGGMAEVASPARRPWADEPRCGSCHNVAGHEYEQAGKLFKDSKGHHGVMCAACHGSPHAIAPSSQPNDNVQAIALQGHAGTIKTCTVCHTQTPGEAFDHRFSGD
ncbi:MAG TPA: hypothetical protein DER07_04175 [Armatimonadetes bacterium]|nr:hypothetical protein [Armatimonadota bacterium]